MGTVVHYLMPPNGMDKKGRHLGFKLLPLEEMPDGVSQMDVEVQRPMARIYLHGPKTKIMYAID